MTCEPTSVVGFRRMGFISADSETLLVSEVGTAVGAAIVIVLSAIGVAIKSFWLKAKKADQEASE